MLHLNSIVATASDQNKTVLRNPIAVQELNTLIPKVNKAILLQPA